MIPHTFFLFSHLRIALPDIGVQEVFDTSRSAFKSTRLSCFRAVADLVSQKLIGFQHILLVFLCTWERDSQTHMADTVISTVAGF